MLKRAWIALLLTIVTLSSVTTSGCGGPDADDAIAAATLVDIRWEAYEPGLGDPDGAVAAGFDRAGLFVPADVAGVSTALQLDTASERTILWRSSLDALSIEYTPSDREASVFGISGHYGTVPSLTIGNYARRDVPVLILDDRETHDTPPTCIGLIGCDLLHGNSLYLDFADSKIAILPGSVHARGRSITCTLDRYGSPILSFRVGDEEIRARYDTGASLFTLLVSQSRFARLTGLSWNSPELYSFSAARPDSPWDMKGAEVNLDLVFGGTRLSCPVVWVRAGTDVSVPEQEISLVGNQLFRGQRIVLNFRSASLTILDPER